MNGTHVSPQASPAPLAVLHVNAGNQYGGVESVLRTFAVEAAGVASLSFSFALCFEGRLASELRAAGAPVFQLGEVRARSPLSVLRARRRLGALLRRERFDVVLLHSPWAHGLLGGVVRKARLPLAFFMHGPAVLDHWSTRLASRVPPAFVFHNSAYTRSASTLFARTPGRVLHCPLGSAPQVAPGERARLRASLGAGDGDVAILQASRLDEWKGHRLHLDALARLRTRRPWRAWFAGGAQRPDERAKLESLVAHARSLGLTDRVSFLGQRSDVPALMSASDLLCQPNTGPEPFGLTFVEALRAGRPVVATAMGGALEIVDETCGMLAKPDAESVARALATLVDDDTLRARLGEAGPARARVVSDPVARLRELEESLRDVVAKSKAR